jgi:hypothetical protein
MDKADKADNTGVNISNMPKKVKISIDKTFEEVLTYDNEGYLIEFEATDGVFPHYTADEYRQLSYLTKGRYDACWEAFKIDEQAKRYEYLERLGFNPIGGNASSRLHIEGEKPNMAYWWERPDEMPNRIRDGWEVCSDPDVKTLQTDSTGVHIIANSEVPELILLHRPRALSEVERKARAEKSNKKLAALDDQYYNDLKKSGVRAIRENEREDLKFTKME